MRRLYSVAAALLIIALMLSGCKALEKLGLQTNLDDDSQPASNISLSEEEAKKLNERVPVLLYFANKEGTKLVAERRYVLASEVKTNLPSTIMKELLAGPTPGTELKAVIPPGTCVNGTVKVEQGTATVDLSKEFVDNLPKDSGADSMAIFSIVNSLTEVKEINKVRFLIDGAVKNQVGRFVFNAPFQRSETIIDKNARINTTGLPEKQESSVSEQRIDTETIEELSDEELEKVFESMDDDIIEE